jgi:hypothetical protein
MKTTIFQRRFLAVGIAVALTLAAESLSAQDATGGQNTIASQAAPQLSSVAAQVLQLSQAHVGEDTIIAFVQNSQGDCALNAAQIIYLKQQGVSENVISAMIKRGNRPGANLPVATETVTRTYTIARSPKGASEATSESPTNCTVMMTATVQPAPVYYYPYPAYPYYYYPYYGYWWPPVSFSFGWGGYWGRGWHGRFHH